MQGSEAKQKVEYLADDWGFHPVVEYSSAGPHSQSKAHFALGEEAVNALKNGKQVRICSRLFIANNESEKKV